MAAIHSHSETLREQLKATAVEVLEIVPLSSRATLLTPEGLRGTDGLVRDAGRRLHRRNHGDHPLRYAEATGNYDAMVEKSNAIFG
jgi:hypothetical protein